MEEVILCLQSFKSCKVVQFIYPEREAMENEAENMWCHSLQLTSRAQIYEKLPECNRIHDSVDTIQNRTACSTDRRTTNNQLFLSHNVQRQPAILHWKNETSPNMDFIFFFLYIEHIHCLGEIKYPIQSLPPAESQIPDNTEYSPSCLYVPPCSSALFFKAFKCHQFSTNVLFFFFVLLQPSLLNFIKSMSHMTH